MAPRNPAPPPPSADDQDWGSGPPGTRTDLMELEDQTDVDRVAILLRGASDDGRASVRVSKVVDGKNLHCQTFTPAEFEEGGYDMIRAAFGHGTFKIMLYGVNSAGNFGLMGREVVTIAESMIPVQRKENPIQQDSGLSQVIAMLADGQKQMLETLTALKSAPPADPMANMERTLSMMTMMRGAMGLDNAPKQKTLVEQMQELQAVRDLAKDLGLEKDGEGDGAGSLLSMLPKALDLIREGMAQNKTAPAVQQLPAVTVPPSLQNNPIPTKPATPENEQVKLAELDALKQQVNQLLAMSDANKTPEEGAAFIDENVTDEQAQEVVDMLNDENWLDMLAFLNPDVRKHTEWLSKVRELALDLLCGPDEPETAPGDLATKAS